MHMHMDKSALYHAHPPEFFFKKNQIGIPTSRGELLLLLENSSMLLPREVVDVMEEDLGEEARRRGVEFGKNSNGGRDGNVRFGRDSAQTGTGWSGDGGRQGCWALDAANRGGAASRGRRDERRRLELVLCAAARERDRDGLNGSFQASAR